MNPTDTAALTALYARQSHAIDEGEAEAWAATFTAEGSFSSPTFGAPIIGTQALAEFAAGVYTDLQTQGLRQRHWVNSVVLDAVTLTARAYLMIVRVDQEGTPTLMRHVVISDELARDSDGDLHVQARTVRRDP